ncbi:MAG: class I SAM-dependent methyltransferase, partial [Phycisphaerae bacterium]
MRAPVKAAKPRSPEGNAAIWGPDSLENPHTVEDKQSRVEAMFDAIAPTYERVNRLATFGRDAAWRRKAIAAIRPQKGDTVLDVCCGTGDMLRMLAQVQPNAARLVGVDFSAGMLAGGVYEPTAAPISLLRGDGQRLPLLDSTMDAVTCAFGVRNFQN